MKGLISKSLAALLASGLLVLSGCYSCQSHRYRYVDPCWPERYSAMARASANHAFGAQVANGHTLEQTIWNYHFEPGTDVLTPGGQTRLAYLMRKLPYPDPHIFLKTAHDVAYDPKQPDEFIKSRAELNAKRQEAIRRYVLAITADHPCPVHVSLHDLAEPDMGAAPALISIQQRDANFQGVLPVSGGAGVSGP